MSNETNSIDGAPIERFRTSRMIATRVIENDYETLCILHADPQTMAALGGVRDAAVTRQFLDDKLSHWERYGHGVWMFRDRDTGAFVGRGLLEHIEVGGNHEVELGYTVSRESWRLGYATEMASAMLCVGFTTLDVASIVAFTYPDNLGSRRIMEKSGLSYERDIEHVGMPHVLYRIQGAEYSSDLTVQMVDGDIVVA